MKLNTQVLIVGNFGYKTNQLDGQTVKTRNVYLLLEKMGYSSIKTIDTSYKSNILQLFNVIFKRQLIVFVGAENAFKYILPILIKLASISKSEIHYFHIGSFLVRLLNSKQAYSKYLNQVKANYPETYEIAGQLEKFDLKNVHILPNFRVVENHLNEFISTRSQEKLKMVFLGRILKTKGIDVIFKTYDLLKNEFENDNLSIDFYGQIVDDGLNFENQLAERSGMCYKSFLEPNKIQDTLSKYDVLIFPTYYVQEGFPGTILDAYLAGVPVISSKWMYNSELVEHDVDGILVEPKNEFALKNAIIELALDSQKLTHLKKNAIAKGERLHYKEVQRTFSKNISKRFSS